jgi:hypothetical protein
MEDKAIRKAYPNVVTIDETTGCFDANNNLVEIDEKLVKIAFETIKATEQAKTEAVKLAKQSALAKLAALGLTADEVTAIIGT